MPLTQLIYVSSATKEMSEKELALILKVSAQNNKKSEITGMLLYGRGRFIQVIEGESIHIDDLMLKIKADSRHRFVTVLESNIIHSRDFPNWSMGFHMVSDTEILSSPNFLDFFEASFDSYKYRINFGVPLIMLKAFAKNLPL
jgi:hypothetical protein